MQRIRECTDYPGSGIHIVLKVFDSKKRKEKGVAEKARIKKKESTGGGRSKMLENNGYIQIPSIE